MFYYLYQITNNVNGKIYVGVHKTKNLDDGYMGSGKVIKSAIKKHGLENFTKVILETFENAEAMYAREKEVVNDEFLLREDVYNLRRGGYGGFDHINKMLSHDDRVKLGRLGGFCNPNPQMIANRHRYGKTGGQGLKNRIARDTAATRDKFKDSIKQIDFSVRGWTIKLRVLCNQAKPGRWLQKNFPEIFETAWRENNK